MKKIDNIEMKLVLDTSEARKEIKALHKDLDRLLSKVTVFGFLLAKLKVALRAEPCK